MEYLKKMATKSRNYLFVGNSYNKDSVIYNISHSDSIKIFDNRCTDYQILFRKDSTNKNIDSTVDTELNIKLSEEIPVIVPLIESPLDPFKGSGKFKGRNNIIMNKWGPYNFRYPIIYQDLPIDSFDRIYFNVFGPSGKWEIISFKGLNKHI